MDSDTQDYSAPVYRTIIKRDNIMGVSKIAFFLLAFLTFLVVVVIEQWVYLFGVLAGYAAIRVMMMSDEYIIEILMDSILSPDTYYA